MNKTIGAIAALVIVVAAVIAITAGGNDTNQKQTTAPVNNTPAQSTSSNASTENDNKSTNTNANNKVTISNFAFSPATIAVKKGAEVTWTNNDSVTHTVTDDSGTGPDSGNLSPGQSYNFTFNSVGTFNYHCALHSSMHGTVTVTD
jgi:plastocyanin